MFAGNALSAFPLRNVNMGDKITLDDLTLVRCSKDQLTAKNKKVLFIWRYDKRLSQKMYGDFESVCKEKTVNCISVELDKKEKDDILKLAKGDSKSCIVFGNENFANRLGVFILPVTIILDEENKIINAFSVESNYKTHLSKYIDYLNGIIKKEDLEALDAKGSKSAPTSHISTINFAKQLIKQNKLQLAESRLSQLNPAELSASEKIKLAELYIELNKVDIAEKLIQDDASGQAVLLKGYIGYLKGKYDEALKLLSENEGRITDKNKLNYLYGLIYNSKKDYENAAKYLLKNENPFFE